MVIVYHKDFTTRIMSPGSFFFPSLWMLVFCPQIHLGSLVLEMLYITGLHAPGLEGCEDESSPSLMIRMGFSADPPRATVVSRPESLLLDIHIWLGFYFLKANIFILVELEHSQSIPLHHIFLYLQLNRHLTEL